MTHLDCMDPDGCNDGDATCSNCWTAVEAGYVEQIASWLEARARCHQRVYNGSAGKVFLAQLAAKRGEVEGCARKLRDGSWRDELEMLGGRP